MRNYKAITKNTHGHLRWKRYENYIFARSDAVVPLVVQEFAKVAVALPSGFIKLNDQFAPAAIQALEPGQNLFVGESGQWIGSYTPAAYRSYPFILAKIEEGGDRFALCVDMDSGLVSEEHELPFFESDGQLAQPVNEVLNFLQQVEDNRSLTLRLCATLDAEGLIVPWDITVSGKNGPTKIRDLHRIDEGKLNSLDPAALNRLHTAGALPIAYCQLISMQHIHALARLAELHAKSEADNRNGKAEPDFFGRDGKIDFSGFN